MTSTQLLQAFLQAEKKVTSKKELLNNLNVYPVPDGDTGTNMSLTLKEIVKELKNKKEASLSELADILSESSLMGARGNSGVILSQFIGGFSNTIRKKRQITQYDILKAFQEGTKEAYESVSSPVEGTILTVMNAATKEISKSTHKKDIRKIIASSVHASQETLRKTPDMLPKLKDAGVVDAGGAGFVFFLEGIYESLTVKNEDAITATDDFISPRLARVWDDSYGPYGTGGFRAFLDFNWRALKHFFTNTGWLFKQFWKTFKIGKNALSMKKAIKLTKRMGNQLKWQNIRRTNSSIFKLLRVWHQTPEERYCMEMILEDVEASAKQIRRKLKKEGNSLIVAKKGKYTKIHLHVMNKIEGKKMLSKFGKVITFKVDDIHKQHEEFMAKKFDTKDNHGTHCIAIINGKGFKQLYESFDGVSIIDGGRTMNPSVSDFLKAIQKVDEQNILIIPNNENTFLTAEKVTKRSDRHISIVKTYDQVQGLTALLNFNPQASVTDNSDMIENALDLLTTIQITRSTRKIRFKKSSIPKNSFIALHKKNILSYGTSLTTITESAVKSLLDSHELVTLYYGQDVEKSASNDMKKYIQKNLNKEVQLYEGGQPHYLYIVAIE